MRPNLFQGILAALVLLVALIAVAVRAGAQPEPVRLSLLEGRVSALESQTPVRTTEGAALMVCGAFCALWAQNTQRNPWLWFFLGVVLNAIAVLVLLKKNAEDRRRVV